MVIKNFISGSFEIIWFFQLRQKLLLNYCGIIKCKQPQANEEINQAWAKVLKALKLEK